MCNLSEFSQNSKSDMSGICLSVGHVEHDQEKSCYSDSYCSRVIKAGIWNNFWHVLNVFFILLHSEVMYKVWKVQM